MHAARLANKEKASELGIYHLNDNPRKRCVWSVASGRLPTLRKSMGPLWLKQKSRRIRNCELVAAMGWDHRVAIPGKPKSYKVCAFLGNSMHFSSVQLMVFIALASCGVPDPSSQDKPGASCKAKPGPKQFAPNNHEQMLIDAFHRAASRAGA